MLHVIEYNPEVLLPVVYKYQNLFLTCKELYSHSFRSSLQRGECYPFTNMSVLIPPPFSANLNRTPLLIVANRTSKEYILFHPSHIHYLLLLNGRWRCKDKVIVYPYMRDSDLEYYGVNDYNFVCISRRVQTHQRMREREQRERTSKLIVACKRYGIEMDGRSEEELMEKVLTWCKFGYI